MQVSDANPNQQNRFKTRYTHCGCPVPGDKVGHRLSRLLSSSGERDQHEFLAPGPDRDDLAAATHPSDHNAVYLLPHLTTGVVPHTDSAGGQWSESMRRDRRTKIMQREERERKELDKAHDRKKEELEAIERRRRQRKENGVYSHDAAFLVPVPIYFCAPAGACAYGGGEAPVTSVGGIGGSTSVSCSQPLALEGCSMLSL